MEANKVYSEGRNLTYGEFPTKFVWKKDHWQPRKQRYSVERLFYVAPGSDLVLNDDEIQNIVLANIEKLLLNVGKSLHDYHGMPYPKPQYFESFQNTLISDELSYDREALRKEHLEFLSKFTDEQLNVHDMIMSSVNSTEGKMFFVYGYGGTGKTFIWRSLSADSMCNIKQGSDLAELIIRSKLIIWDETPMIHKHCIEAVDRTFRDILRVCSESSVHKPFGGKTIVFGGDFRQILPVVLKGSRQNVVNATINSSYLWSSCIVLRLTKNMRLLSVESSVEASKLKEFSSWVASVGDGVVGGPNDGEVAIDLPSDIILSNSGDPLKTIVESIYPSYMDPEELSNCLHDRAILAPTLDVVDEVNQFMISVHQAPGRV
ncbi:uncharacterized protein LOC125209150 [Salvia hispanica]|uniref:uncharacterized protein LOC125209150 n=1 Tax=Salvia hispanica TaxID=49212 RepID=UPI002009092D|nr:uncharacterized protein LOC125209150 [Salvia hispanica]